MESKFWELLVVLAIVVLLFGPNRLAGLGAGVGRAMREFREATKPEQPEATGNRSDPAAKP